MVRFIKHHMTTLEGIEIWPLLSFAIFFVFFVILAVRVIMMRKPHIDHLSNLPFEDRKTSKIGMWILLPLLGISNGAIAQELVSEVSEVATSNLGIHFGMSDDIWIVILLSSAVLFTAMILGASGVLKNLIVFSARSSKNLNSLGIPVIASVFVLTDSTFWGLVFGNIFLMLFLLLILRNIRIFSDELRPKKLEEESLEASFVEKEASIWSKIWRRLNGHVEIADEADLMMDHSYDGIMELDNRLPPWGLYGFYTSIMFGVLYIFNYHVFKYTPLQIEEYELEMIDAKAEVDAYLVSMSLNVDESSVIYNPSSQRLLSGKILYDLNCVVCHATDGGGGVGPNFADEFWINGGSIGDVFKSIKYGVPSKGMRAWATDFSPVEIQNLATYVKSFQGTTPLAPKAPQGDKE